ncbi:unnamed protein product [Nyctereutes procyonoides]|uniref:Cytochrome b-c1 complex subunit 7 n=1 Tax=Nyctereutes procyonoides TaxID=34880 RepID=A0A811ZE98_NYCPR|nr:unnamed protein product [Nyctereutes procyonoides]
MRGRPVAASSRWLEGIRKWYYNAAGFNKLGLMQDDTIYENEDVKEAIRRLPENLYNDRMFHIKRALDLTRSIRSYKFHLEPYLKEVIQERKERENGQRNNHGVEICGCSCPQILRRSWVNLKCTILELFELQMFYFK